MGKKVLIFITIIMLLLSISYEVKADSEAPSSAGYRVVVKNTQGTPLYLKGKVVTTIPYKGVADVMYEAYDSTDKKILFVTYKNYDAGFNSYYVRAEDVLPKDYDLSDATKLDEKQEIIVLNKNGGILREGPSEIYNKLSKTIPTGTTVTYQYIDNGYGMWSYVEYEGVKGWLYTYAYKESSLGPSYVVNKTKPYIELLTIGKTAKLYSTVYTEKDEVIATISINTKLDCKYEYVNSCYVEYNGQFGWVNFDENFVYKSNYNNENDKLLVIYDTSLYKDSDFKNKYNITISGNNFYNEFYYRYYNEIEGFVAPYYVKYKNQYGWVNEENVAYCSAYELNESKIINKDLTIYDKPNINSEIISTISNGTTIKTHCEKIIENEDKLSSWVFVEYGDIIGWVMSDILYDEEDKPIVENEELEKPNDESKENNIKWYNKLTPVQFALLCIGAAIVLGVTSIVIILLVKKINDKKSENNNLTKNESQKIEKDDGKDKETTIIKEITNDKSN